MAQKRMFDKRVIDTDKFADLPNSTKALYFIAGMFADDKGFFQPKSLQRQYGFSDDDYKILIAKKFFIVFESGIMIITDWKKNNWLDSRRITETEYVDEIRLLETVNEKYELKTDCAKRMLSEYSIEENRIEENSIVESSIDKVPNKFKKPTLDELKDYIEEASLTIDPSQFIDYYESVDWKVGRNKMKDWKATIRNWERRNKKDVVGTPDWFEKDIKKEKVSKEEQERIKKMIGEI